jgi:hypothetical protein
LEALLKGEGKCLDAVKKVTETSQEVYGCFKENFGRLKSVVCTPPEKHKALTSSLSAVLTTANVIAMITLPIQSLPYIGPPAKVMNKVAKVVKKLIKPKVRVLKKFRRAPRGTRFENSNCCPPLVKDRSCHAYPGSTYKCASCSSGIMCYMARACNTLNKIEEKVDEWKAKYYDPFVDKIVQSAEYYQGISNQVHKGCFLWGCGFKECDWVMKMATKLENEVRSKFLNRFCPIRLPRVRLPDFSKAMGALNFLRKIGKAFEKIKRALQKQHCMRLPKPYGGFRRKCTRVCLPCCGSRRRRRWISAKCGTCCHRACAKVPYGGVRMVRYCFSASKILKGLGAVFKAVLGPILNVINRIIDAIMRPVVSLFNRILRMLGISVDWRISPLPKLNMRVPMLPKNRDCATMRKLAGLSPMRRRR